MISQLSAKYQIGAIHTADTNITMWWFVTESIRERKPENPPGYATALFLISRWPSNDGDFRLRCHGLSVYPVCVCNTVRLGQDTTWNRRVHGLSVYPVWVCVCVCVCVCIHVNQTEAKWRSFCNRRRTCLLTGNECRTCTAHAAHSSRPSMPLYSYNHRRTFKPNPRVTHSGDSVTSTRYLGITKSR